MKNYQTLFLFWVTISIYCFFNVSTLHAIDNTDSENTALTQEQAAILASKIANDKFQKDFGYSPFKPDSYKAELVDNRWHWGEIKPAGINGCSAEVTFDRDGSDENVKIAFFIDKLLDCDIKRHPTRIEKIIPGGNLKE